MDEAIKFAEYCILDYCGFNRQRRNPHGYLHTFFFASTVTFKTPAPGAYSPEKVHPQGERHAPVYSMGNRTRYRKRKKAVIAF